MRLNTQLLCTFTRRDRLHKTINAIITSYEIVFNKIYVLQNEQDFHQLLCTYNIEENRENYVIDVDTISLHRKKQTNTLYTINSLNEIIRKENNGKLDKSFPIEWENYRNCMLLTNNDGFSRVPTRIYMIIDTTTWGKN